MKKILQVRVVFPVTDMEILRAQKSDGRDFEDALQIVCAEMNLVNIQVTNNKKNLIGYTELPLYTSSEFVKRMMR